MVTIEVTPEQRDVLMSLTSAARMECLDEYRKYTQPATYDHQVSNHWLRLVAVYNGVLIAIHQGVGDR